MTRYYVGAWVEQGRPERGTRTLPEVKSTKAAAIRYAERTLPPGVEYVVTTLHRTVATGSVPTTVTHQGCGRRHRPFTPCPRAEVDA